MTQETE